MRKTLTLRRPNTVPSFVPTSNSSSQGRQLKPASQRALRLARRSLAFGTWGSASSGGTTDAMAMAIAHKKGNVVVLGCLVERIPPFSPDSLCREFAATFQAYGVSKILGDRYAGEWPREAFLRYSIEYQPCSKSKSEIYGTLLPLINSGRVDLLDDKALIGQLVNLERRVGWGGRDSIDHGPGTHDDRINVAAGALIGASEAASLGQAGFFDFITSDLRKRAEAAELDCAQTK